MYEREHRDAIGFPVDEVLEVSTTTRRLLAVLRWAVVAAAGTLLALGGVDLAAHGLLG